MEPSLNIEQLQLKSEHLHANPKLTHYHENDTDPLFVSWDDCVTVLYPLNCLAEATLWNPVEPAVSSYLKHLNTLMIFNNTMVIKFYIFYSHKRTAPIIFKFELSILISNLFFSCRSCL